MVKILFVCHGNICRSPMAEFAMRQMVQQAGLGDRIYVESAAASREEIGSGVYPAAKRELARHGISCDFHRARQITADDLERFDRIYYMDGYNQRRLERMFPEYDRFMPLLDRPVTDPWPDGDFSQTWEDIQEGCRRILEELK